MRRDLSQDLRRLDTASLRELESDRTLSNSDWRRVVAELATRAADGGSPPHLELKAPQHRRRLKAAKIFALATGGFLAAVVALVAALPNRPDEPPAAVSPPVRHVEVQYDPDIVVSPTELFDDYQANEIAADRRFRSKRIGTRGRVMTIAKTWADQPYLTLNAHDEFSSVIAYLAPAATEEAATLRPGVSVSLVCRGGGVVLRSPVLSGCLIDH